MALAARPTRARPNRTTDIGPFGAERLTHAGLEPAGVRIRRGDAVTRADADLDRIAVAVNAAHAACETASRAAVQHALDAGRLLLLAKQALPHGSWGAWLAANVTFSARTAQAYMALARQWPDLQANPQRVADLGELPLRELLQVLATPQTAGESRGADSDEWFTPEPVIAAARECLGAIDLDPASCVMAQTVVQAATYFTRADDGLSRPWHGRVWLNPPYSRIEDFAGKLFTEDDAGHIDAAIMLTNSATDAGWFCALAERYPVIFSRGRVRFWHPDKVSDAPRFGQALFAVNMAPERFAAAFAATCYAPIAIGPGTQS